MTEAEWLACRDPNVMLMFLKDHQPAKVWTRLRRKIRLFACACCRQVWHLLTNESDRRKVEVAERYADGLVSGPEWETIRKENASLAWALHPAGRATGAAATVLHCEVFFAASGVVNWSDCIPGVSSQADLFRDILGNPFHERLIDRSRLEWNDPTAQRLAQSAYEQRAFDCLPILADALEDAGCADSPILGHLRGPGPHVRGCWVIDLLLRKE
jgi:hypothetical protein